VLSKGAYHKIGADLHQALKASRIDIEDRENERNLYLSLLYTELETLDVLYKTGIIPQYTRIDIRQQVQTERDMLYSGASLDEIVKEDARAGLFARFEQYLLGYMREREWSLRLLTEYQYMRLSQHYRRDVARLMMVESSIAVLKSDESQSESMQEELLSHLNSRREHLKHLMDGYKRDMPEFYRRYSYRIASQAAWFGAITEADLLYQHGQMGGKAHARISALLSAKFRALPHVSVTVPKISTRELIETVPLFSGLSEEAVDELVVRAAAVTFLADDRVIGEGEHGDALYIVVHGLLRVHKEGDGHEIALLEDGDFFGEMALLGEPVRQVNVSAIHTCELLRIKRDDVLELSTRFPQIGQRLHEVEEQRRNANVKRH